MSMKATIEKKLGVLFSPLYLEVVDESHNHNVPDDAETHFKVLMVADAFDGVMAVKRHQQVYGALKEEMSGSVHALALHLHTPMEWSAKGGTVPDSPNCLGGSKTS